MSVSYLVAWDQAGLAIVAGGLVLACDSGGDEEGKDEIMEVEHDYCWAFWLDWWRTVVSGWMWVTRIGYMSGLDCLNSPRERREAAGALVTRCEEHAGEEA